ncbi:MAG TPA: hypothetical protein VFN88_12030 [Caulobacteraceae bacterium]|nr:hypothetical protein [Caulobacteraceae bacterium]
MKRILIAAAVCLPLAACGPKPATFQIEAEGVEKATLSLCGEKSPMKQTGNIFAVDRKISCSGEGDILLKYKNGPEVACHIQYVTAKFPGYWKYFAQGGQCGLDSLENKDIPKPKEKPAEKPAPPAANAPR